jgi:broad specificity phosphatase PhoE
VVDIVLVRHASTDWSGTRYCGVSDPPLSEAGRLEALRVARVLAEQVGPETRIVTSPSRRAVATAMAIADAVGADPVEVDSRWREADLGVAAARSRSTGRTGRRTPRSRPASRRRGATWRARADRPSW